jgi:hypothetical protein
MTSNVLLRCVPSRFVISRSAGLCSVALNIVVSPFCEDKLISRRNVFDLRGEKALVAFRSWTPHLDPNGRETFRLIRSRTRELRQHAHSTFVSTASYSSSVL